jgi:hypothetical protein
MYDEPVPQEEKGWLATAEVAMARFFLFAFLAAALGLLSLSHTESSAEAPVSDETDECLGCHEDAHPGIVGG